MELDFGPDMSDITRKQIDMPNKTELTKLLRTVKYSGMNPQFRAHLLSRLARQRNMTAVSICQQLVLARRDYNMDRRPAHRATPELLRAIIPAIVQDAEVCRGTLTVLERVVDYSRRNQ